MGYDLTEKIMQQLNRISSKPYTFFEHDLVNYTPYAAGDYDSKAFRCINNKCFPTRAHLAQQLRGRMRWLARVTLAGLPGCSQPYLTYDRVERDCFKVRIRSSENNGSVLEMGLIEFMFGTLNAREYTSSKRRRVSFSSPFKLNVELNYVEPLVLSGIRDREHYNRHITSIRQGSIKYINPGKVILKLVIQIDPFICKLDGRIGKRSLKEVLPSMASFYASLALLTLTVLGVGKRVNRGFGRFMPLEPNLLRLLPFYCDRKIITISESRESNNGERVITILPDLIKAHNSKDAYDLLKKLLKSPIAEATRITGTSLPSGWQLATIPSLVTATFGYNTSGDSKISGVRVVESKGIKTIDDAINAIARCVNEKNLSRMKNFYKRLDPSRFAWVLGLPRRGISRRRQSMIILFPLLDPKLIAIIPFFAIDKELNRGQSEEVLNAFKEAYEAVSFCLSSRKGE